MTLTGGNDARVSAALLPGRAPEQSEGVRAGANAAWDDLPVLPGTRLRMELALCADPPNLRELTALLREDPVAVLRVFALGPAMFAVADDSLRLESLVATLGRADLLQAVCGQSPARGTGAAAALAFAQQAVTIARLCRTLAETVGLPAEMAYLVGLLHRIGSLPGQLGRRIPPATTSDRGCIVLALCRHYALPVSLAQAVDEATRQDPASPWTAMIHAAYELMEGTEPSTVPFTRLSATASPGQVF